MTPEFLYLCFVGAVVGWTAGATLADPGYLTGGLRVLWATYVRMFNAARRMIVR